jgi:hypothetical protein
MNHRGSFDRTNADRSNSMDRSGERGERNNGGGSQSMSSERSK